MIKRNILLPISSDDDNWYAIDPNSGPVVNRKKEIFFNYSTGFQEHLFLADDWFETNNCFRYQLTEEEATLRILKGKDK